MCGTVAEVPGEYPPLMGQSGGPMRYRLRTLMILVTVVAFVVAILSEGDRRSRILLH